MPAVPRKGIDAERVVEEAEAMADEAGQPSVSLAALALRLGVKQPSLYKHVAGADALRRAMTIRARWEVYSVLARAAAGLARHAAVTAVCHAYRAWATDSPGRYVLTVRAPDVDDPEDVEASEAVLAVLTDVLAGYGLTGGEAVHAIRALRAVVHGFLDLERLGSLGAPTDADSSFDRLVIGLTVLLDEWASGE